MDSSIFIAHCLSFDEVIELPHFEKTSFRVNKKIFATLNIQKREATFKLSAIDQSVFCDFDRNSIWPATGAWGKQGWTIFDLTALTDEMLIDALTLSYCNVAPKKLSEKYKY
ncbi:MmcQ/YjbR family DNA-binding protein [Pedobacter sp. ISL-68]|uniref:MmcQ/YjbR family DNA-binding protein n=1 Tax=unclassified Pedobacter TaxID=2628915 RepID=UPI001BE5F89B|nr:MULTISPECIES: MmcQ/YjbR family DNA-binding protein [unclassified Pedobacter]MBT2561527.1 MmcQ/YjbR family DNA-binding protein [Pedobacter sp. ISL-64]MBT2590916.1 MmcQ/YjbR family DNA-binding protein [Pedobacter sp. ISL-68]